MAICPPLTVAAPPVTPKGGGLFSVARFPELPTDGNGNRWECGLQYQANHCAFPNGWRPVCPPDVPPVKESDPPFQLIQAPPFQVVLGVNCKLTGNTLEGFRRNVVDSFTLCEQRAVEEIFWTGSQGNASLSRPGAAVADQCSTPTGVTVDNPLTLTKGLAELEEFLSDTYCGTGVIHAPPYLAPYVAREQWLCGCGGPGPVTTPLGTRWSFGGGYTTSGPDGTSAPADVFWLYATGQINIWRSEVWVNPDDLRYAFDTRSNDVELFAERTYAISIDGCACMAVPVTLA